MRLKIICEVSGKQLPLDHRRKILMMLKEKLSKQNPRLYANLFEKNKMKYYTFSVFIPNSSFSKDCILLNGKQEIIINFSTSDAEIGMNFFNAFLGLRNKDVLWQKGIGVVVRSIDLVHQQPITQGEVICRALSPIVCRDHNRELKKDWFYSFSANEFVPVLKRNLAIKLVPKLGDYISYDIDDLQINPIQMKKTVIRHYEKQMECSIGRMVLIGKPHLLNELVDNGLGSMTGTGFGMLEKV